VKDRDLIPGGRSIREVSLHRIADLQLAALFEQQNRCRGELLGHRAQPELRVRRIGDVPLQVGGPVAFAEQDLVAARHERRAHELVIGHIGLNHLIQAGGILRQANARRE
jgi:hypothetical protein